MHAPVAIKGSTTMRGSSITDAIAGRITMAIMEAMMTRMEYMQTYEDLSSRISLIFAVCVSTKYFICDEAQARK